MSSTYEFVRISG